MRKCTVRILFLLVALVGLGHADETVFWAGYQWDTQGFGSLQVANDSLQLQVTSTTNNPWSWGIAHTQPAGFSSYMAPWMQVTFTDTSSSGTGGLLAFENPLGSSSLWGEVGYDPGISTTNYGVWVDDGSQTQLVILGQRTDGNHTLSIGRLANGTVDFYLDNQLVSTSQVLDTNSFKDVYLFANGMAADAGGTVTFISFAAGDGYARGANGMFDPVQPVPEPTSLVLLAAGLCVLSGAIRRFHAPQRNQMEPM